MAAVEDAVLVAGGIGSRMLPASAAIAKEALPLVDIPALSRFSLIEEHQYLTVRWEKLNRR